MDIFLQRILNFYLDVYWLCDSGKNYNSREHDGGEDEFLFLWKF